MVVLDASMTIAWLFAKERASAPREALRRVVAEGATVPAIWRLEVANVLRTAVRKGRCGDAYAERSLERLSRLRITVDGETDTLAWRETAQLARRYDLTTYDAAYLELAIRLAGPLASRDRALIKAAKHSALEVIA